MRWRIKFLVLGLGVIFSARIYTRSQALLFSHYDPSLTIIDAGALIVGATGLAPPVVSSLAVRAISGQRLFNLVVSNVPGPQQTFYLAGAPLLEAFPAVPLNPRNQALSVGILSYDGGIYFGLLADRDALPDVEEAAVGLEQALTSLVAASDT